MAPISPPAYQQANTYSARLDRLTLGSLLVPRPVTGPLTSRPGVNPNPPAMAVTQRATPDRWVTVGAGTVYINASSAVGGMYIGWNDAAFDVETAVSHASLNRRDLVIARVYDAYDDTGTDNKFAIEVVTGTPAAAPVRPAAPSQTHMLAEVYVPAGSSAVTNANITDLRQMAVMLGGIVPVGVTPLDAPNPANNYAGIAVFDVSAKKLRIGDGSVYNDVPFGSWTPYTPVMSAQTTPPNLGSGAQFEGAYCQIGKTVHARANIKAGTSGVSSGSGIVRTSVPVAAKTLGAGGFHFGSCMVFSGTGNNLFGGQVRIGANSGWSVVEWLIDSILWSGSAGFSITNNSLLGFSITYEAA